MIERPSSIRWEITPSIYPLALALLINIANMSTTILNRIGDNGSSCLTPFLVLNFFQLDH
jgi:hypothetical protein